ncbi:MAG TPA: hypothetical protein VGF94_00115 [Kofleriaceae bacterium]|jgi:hypothetical protein
MRLTIVLALAACSFPTKHPGATGDGGGDGGSDGLVPDASPFGCTGQPFGTTAPPEIMIQGNASDLGLGTAQSGLAVDGMLDAGGMFFTATTDSNGNFGTVVDTTGAAQAGYVVTEAGANVPAYFYPAHPFDADSVVALPTLTMMELGQVGNPAGTALVELILGDCLGTALAGCTIAITPAPSLQEYTKDGTPSLTATSTEANGYVIAYGIAPGTASFQATCPTGPLRATSISLVADSTYFIRIEP